MLKLLRLLPTLLAASALLGTKGEAQVFVDGNYATSYSNITTALGTISGGGHVIEVDDSTAITISDNVVIPGSLEPIIIRSLNNIYPPNVTIDGGSNGSVFVFEGGITGASLLHGFRITNGSGTSHSGVLVGGGIACFDGASPLIRNCVIVENTADNGGGVYIELLDTTPGPRLMRNMINFGGMPQFSLSRFNKNTAGQSGGGMFAFAGTRPELEHCTFTGNTAALLDGGAVCFMGTRQASITGSLMQENAAGRWGGGLAVLGGADTTSVTHSQFSENIATTGGGIYEAENFFTANTFCNDLIVGNRAVHGGGLATGGVFSTPPQVSLCTFADNIATGLNGGGAIWNEGILLDHSILWGNSPPALVNAGGTQTVTNSNVEAVDPLFTGGTVPACWFAPVDTYHLDPSSPMVDAGTYLVEDAPCDIEGRSTHPDHTIPDTGLVDLGYHYPGLGCP
jgi:hypothetical protein